MSRSYHRFTKQDDDIIINHIEATDKLTIGLKNAAIQLNLTEASITSHYRTGKAFEKIRETRKKERTKHFNTVTKTLVKEIQKNPDNLREAFKQTAAKTNMSPATIACAYYTKKSSYINRSKIGVCFTLMSKDKVIYNGKNTEKNQPRVWKDKSNSLLNFFRNIFHINYKK